MWENAKNALISYFTTIPQYAEGGLNKFLSPRDGTYRGWMGMLQEFQKYFAWNRTIWGIKSTKDCPY